LISLQHNKEHLVLKFSQKHPPVEKRQAFPLEKFKFLTFKPEVANISATKAEPLNKQNFPLPYIFTLLNIAAFETLKQLVEIQEFVCIKFEFIRSTSTSGAVIEQLNDALEKQAQSQKKLFAQTVVLDKISKELLAFVVQKTQPDIPVQYDKFG
jgi:hypothetical protein